MICVIRCKIGTELYKLAKGQFAYLEIKNLIVKEMLEAFAEPYRTKAGQLYISFDSKEKGYETWLRKNKGKFIEVVEPGFNSNPQIKKFVFNKDSAYYKKTFSKIANEKYPNFATEYKKQYNSFMKIWVKTFGENVAIKKELALADGIYFRVDVSDFSLKETEFELVSFSEYSQHVYEDVILEPDSTQINPNSNGFMGYITIGQMQILMDLLRDDIEKLMSKETAEGWLSENEKVKLMNELSFLQETIKSYNVVVKTNTKNPQWSYLGDVPVC